MSEDFEFEAENDHHEHVPGAPPGLESVRLAIYEVVSGFVLTLECETGHAITTFISPERAEQLAAVILHSLEQNGYFEDEDLEEEEDDDA